MLEACGNSADTGGGSLTHQLLLLAWSTCREHHCTVQTQKAEAPSPFPSFNRFGHSQQTYTGMPSLSACVSC